MTIPSAAVIEMACAEVAADPALAMRRKQACAEELRAAGIAVTAEMLNAYYLGLRVAAALELEGGTL